MKEDSKKKKWPKRLVIALIVIMLFGAGGFYAYVSDYYHAGDTALGLTQEMKTAGVLEESDQAIKIGEPQMKTGIVIYPGAKVDPYAYVPLANELSNSGYYALLRKCHST